MTGTPPRLTPEKSLRELSRDSPESLPHEAQIRWYWEGLHVLKRARFLLAVWA